jgi:hypothetical protein
LTEKPAVWARFSPGSKQIACGYRFDAVIKLTILNAENGLRWTPDGKAVTYRDWNNGIWQQHLSGGAPRRIAGLPEEKLYPYGWSRDGKLFAFTRGNTRFGIDSKCEIILRRN